MLLAWLYQHFREAWKGGGLLQWGLSGFLKSALQKAW